MLETIFQALIIILINIELEKWLASTKNTYFYILKVETINVYN